MNSYEKIRAACIAANPEIVELKFGCEVIRLKDKRIGYVQSGSASEVEEGVWLGHVLWLGNKVVAPTIMGDTYGVAILGRPIRLADVLLAIRANRNAANGVYGIKDDGELMHISFQGITILPIRWNLRQDDLTKQSPGAIDFLFTLL